MNSSPSPRRVGIGDRLGRGARAEAGAVDDRVVRALRPVPAAIAVHRPVAAGDARDGGAPAEARLELRQEGVGGTRRRVAAVGERVEANPVGREAATSGELDHRDDVLVDGVDAAGSDEPHQVQASATRRGPARRRH